MHWLCFALRLCNLAIKLASDNTVNSWITSSLCHITYIIINGITTIRSKYRTSVGFRSLIPSVSTSTRGDLLAGCLTSGSRSSGWSMSWSVVPLASTGTRCCTGGIGTLGTTGRIIPATLWRSICLDGIPAWLGLLVRCLVGRTDARYVPTTSLCWRLAVHRSIHRLQCSLLRLRLHLLYQCFLHNNTTTNTKNWAIAKLQENPPQLLVRHSDNICTTVPPSDYDVLQCQLFLDSGEWVPNGYKRC